MGRRGKTIAAGRARRDEAEPRLVAERTHWCHRRSWVRARERTVAATRSRPGRRPRKAAGGVVGLGCSRGWESSCGRPAARRPDTILVRRCAGRQDKNVSCQALHDFVSGSGLPLGRVACRVTGARKPRTRLQRLIATVGRVRGTCYPRHAIHTPSISGIPLDFLQAFLSKTGTFGHELDPQHRARRRPADRRKP